MDFAYYSIITADVLFDEELSSTEKLLFAVITSLTKKEGYCYATNDYLANVIKKDSRTVQRILKKLSDKGDLTIVLKDGFERTIYIGRREIAGSTRGMTQMSSPPDINVTPPRHDSHPSHDTGVTNISKSKLNSISLSKNLKFRTLQECIAHAEKEKYLDSINVEEFHKYYYSDPEDPPKLGMAKLMMSWAKKPENQIRKPVVKDSLTTQTIKISDLTQKIHEISRLVHINADYFVDLAGKLTRTETGFELLPVEDFDCEKWREVLENINVKLR